MKIVSSPIKEVIDIVGAQLVQSCALRKSSFYYEVKIKNGYVLYNTLTKEILFVDEEEYHDDAIKNVLVEKWFYVPSEFNEMNFVDDIRNVIKYTLCQPSGFVSYIILPTTDCNARCFYCFEANSKKIAMTDKVVCRVIDYIDRTRYKDSKLSLQWFGGEPLMNKKAINTICSSLTERKIDFVSSMISNGYLFDEETIDDTKKKWNLRKVQITLDGTEKTYNRVKSYVYKDDNAYKRVLDNIDNLLCSEIDVSIRLNIDAYNKKDIRCLVNELALRFKGKKGLTIYSHTLFEEVGKCGGFVRTNERRKEICDFQKSLENEIVSLGLADGKHYMIDKKFKDHFCMADTSGSIVILPDGHLTKCESSLDGDYVGHIDDEYLNETMLVKYGKYCEKLEECKHCILYPDCIRLVVCHEFGKCHKEFRDKRISDLKDSIIYEYNVFCEHENKERVNKERAE